MTDNYAQVKRDAQVRADAEGFHFRIVKDFFGQYAATAVPRPGMQFGRDLEGELVSPTTWKVGWDDQYQTAISRHS